jgi:hypothetical protein
MDAQAIKNLGGALQITGVMIVAWDLLNIHQYLGGLDRLIKEVRGEVRRLQELTTGGIGLRWIGVPILLFGVAFGAWPNA